jgi:hypothetical protein
VPVRFPETLLAEVRERAAADDRSVSNWIRRAVEHELRKNASEPQPTREGDLRFPVERVLFFGGQAEPVRGSLTVGE